MSTTEPADLRTKRLREQAEEALYGPWRHQQHPPGRHPRQLLLVGFQRPGGELVMTQEVRKPPDTSRGQSPTQIPPGQPISF